MIAKNSLSRQTDLLVPSTLHMKSGNKEKFRLATRTVTKVKSVPKIKEHNRLCFGTLELTSYCYCGDNA